MSSLFKFIGLLLVLGGLGIIGFIYWPLIGQEIRYRSFQTDSRSGLGEEIIPQSIDFGLVIPKIGINTRVFANVNANSPSEYLPLLAQGVAHAKRSVLPGEIGNVFIFAHSADSPLNITRYNAVFYLINRLKENDEIFVYYQRQKYTYKVTEKKIIPPELMSNYFYSLSEESNLILQTCHPPGTTLNRLLVVAEEVQG